MTKPRAGYTLICEFCKKKYYVPAYRSTISKYCSRSCGAKAVRVESTSNCLVCGTTFTHIASRCKKAKYCSRTCYYKAMRIRGTVTATCKHCHKEFLTSPSHKRIYCSKACVNKETKKTFTASFTTVRKQMIARGMIEQCERCGYNEHKQILGVHHKDRNRENNSKENLEVLCPMCHSIEHMRHISVTITRPVRSTLLD